MSEAWKKIQPLRVSGGWTIGSNNFFEVDLSEDTVEWFSEYVIIDGYRDSDNLYFDVEYLPGYGPYGKLVISFFALRTKGDFQNYNMKQTIETESRGDVVRYIEEFMIHGKIIDTSQEKSICEVQGKLQPLRIANGWTIDTNNFYEDDLYKKIRSPVLIRGHRRKPNLEFRVMHESKESLPGEFVIYFFKVVTILDKILDKIVLDEKIINHINVADKDKLIKCIEEITLCHKLAGN